MRAAYINLGRTASVTSEVVVWAWDCEMPGPSHPVARLQVGKCLYIKRTCCSIAKMPAADTSDSKETAFFQGRY